MPFSLEDKITYDELAPSLQAMLGINKYNDMIEDMMQNADDGQLLKVGKDKTIFADDNFYIIRVATNKTEQEQMKKLGPINLEEVFKTWKGLSYNAPSLSAYYSPWYPGQRTDYMGYPDGRVPYRCVPIKSGYYYNKNDKCIYCPVNSDSRSGFVSEKLYSKLWIKIRMYGLDDDDDDCGFTIAGYWDKDGIFRDITILRSGGNQNSFAGIQIVYDFFYSDRKTLVSHNCPACDWGNSFIEFYAEKVPGKIISKTGDRNSNTINENYTIELELPDEKPSDWSDKMWEDIKYLILQPGQVAFCNHSEPSRYMIIDQQELFEEDEIYDLDEDAIYAWINNEWVKVSNTSDVLPHKVWLYNPVLNNLYWYDSPGKYIKIESNMISNIKTAAEGQLPKIMNDGTIDMHDNFIKLYAVDNNTDFSHAQSVLTTDGDTIYRLDINKKYVYFRATANWVEKPIDLHDIPCRIFIYNEALHRFFFYTEPGVYYRMTLRNFDVI